MKVGKDHLCRDTLEKGGLQKQRFESLNIAGIHVGTEHDDLAAIIFRQWLITFTGDSIDLRNDGRCMRFDDLRTIIEVSLKAIVVRRVVARSKDNTGIGPKFAHGEGKLRRRARTFEEVSVAAVFGCNLGAELGKIAREMPRVVSKYNRRFANSRHGLFCVGNKTANRTANIVEIHRRGSDTWVLGASVGAACALLGLCDHAADCASTQTAGTEGKGFVKAIVELSPLATGRQFADHSRGKIRG